MKASERRQAILRVLCERRQEKVDNLAFEFNVAGRTIQRDVLELSLSYPIYTVQGKYGGGVYIADDYYLNKQYLSTAEQEVLEKLFDKVTASEKAVLQSIVRRFGRKKGVE